MTNGYVKTNLLRLKNEIALYKPRIIAVTKYYDVDAILEAYSEGLRDFGEARINDAIAKIDTLSDEIKKTSHFHFIGHLQTNKVAKVVKYFDLIQSVDSFHLAEAISKEAEKINKKQEILLQVNISQESQKFGFEIDELKKVMNELLNLKGIQIKGLMCMAPLNADEMTLNKVFSTAKNLKDELNHNFGLNMQELSMGMSDDYKVALQNGATMIRIGRLLFN